MSTPGIEIPNRDHVVVLFLVTFGCLTDDDWSMRGDYRMKALPAFKQLHQRLMKLHLPVQVKAYRRFVDQKKAARSSMTLRTLANTSTRFCSPVLRLAKAMTFPFRSVTCPQT